MIAIHPALLCLFVIIALFMGAIIGVVLFSAILETPSDDTRDYLWTDKSEGL